MCSLLASLYAILFESTELNRITASMNYHIHKAQDRGTSSLDWLQSNFSFSFADYHSPARMGFGALRVLNDDTIAGRSGFGPHPHRDMEIITIMLSGKLTHEDSTGVKVTISPGEVQVMSAGTGVVHSEINHENDPVELLQLWIYTKEQGIAPRHEKISYQLEANKPTVVASGYKEAQAAYIHQDARISLCYLEENQKLEIEAKDTQGVFLFVIDGALEFMKEDIEKRDSLELEKGKGNVIAKTLSYILVIEVPLEI